jgi:hypothetical protein
MHPVIDNTSHQLAKWLKESGRRRLALAVAPEPVHVDAARRANPSRPWISAPHRKWLLLGGLTVLAYLEYFFADVLLQIATIPEFLVFVFVNGKWPV